MRISVLRLREKLREKSDFVNKKKDTNGCVIAFCNYTRCNRLNENDVFVYQWHEYQRTIFTYLVPVQWMGHPLLHVWRVCLKIITLLSFKATCKCHAQSFIKFKKKWTSWIISCIWCSNWDLCVGVWVCGGVFRWGLAAHLRIHCFSYLTDTWLTKTGSFILRRVELKTEIRSMICSATSVWFI